jgi:hypothetical protein
MLFHNYINFLIHVDKIQHHNKKSFIYDNKLVSLNFIKNDDDEKEKIEKERRTLYNKKAYDKKKN